MYQARQGYRRIPCVCLCILLQWRTIRSPCRRTATVRFLAIVRVLLISRGSWRVLYYYRIFSITTRRNPLLLPQPDTRRYSAHPSPCRSRQPCIVLARTVLTSVPLSVESLPVSFTAAELLATIVRSTVSRDRPHLIRSPQIDDTAPIQATADCINKCPFEC